MLNLIFKPISKYISIKTYDNRKIGKIFYCHINMGWNYKFSYMLTDYKGKKFHPCWEQSKEELLEFIKINNI